MHENLIAEARRLADKVTPEPWVASHFCAVNMRNHVRMFNALTQDDAAFIARSRTLVPALADALEAAIEDFEAYVASGVPNPAPYCANACKDCVDGRVWCKEDRSTCKGFAVRTGGAG